MSNEPLYNIDVNDPRLVKAAKESGLAALYRDDPVLLRFYMKKLLKRGWAGQLGPEESKYATLVRKAFGRAMSEERIAVFRQATAQKPR